MKQALIVGGGPVDLNQLAEHLALQPEITIAADRGGDYFRRLQQMPQMLLGDFDSLATEDLAFFQAAGVRILTFPEDKDQTDLELALDQAVMAGSQQITILGGLGARIDHTLGNIGLLIKAWQQGIETHLKDLTHDLWVAGPGTTPIPAKPGWAVSLVPLTPTVTGITTAGLEFPLTNERLHMDSSRGIHNRTGVSDAKIEIRDGILLIIHFRE